MPDSNTMSTNAAGFYLDYTAAASGSKTFEFKTENKFVDQNIRFNLTVPAAAGLAVENNNISTLLTMGTASNGVYSPSTTLDLVTTSDGWVTDGSHLASSIVGTVNQSTMTLGGSTLASGTTVDPGASTQTITISEGYNTARTIIVGTTASGEAGSVTSGSATISSLSYAYDSTSSKFNITGSADVSAPIVNTAGHISSSIGTRSVNAGGAVVSTTVDKIRLIATFSENAHGTNKPTLSKQSITISGVTDAANGDATSTAPASGVYVAVKSNSSTKMISCSPEVTTAGYGTPENFTVHGMSNITVGAAASSVHYIPIKTTSLSVSDNVITYNAGWLAAGTTTISGGTIQSGTSNSGTLSINWDSTNSKFVSNLSGTIAAPTVSTAGYISNTVGTKNTNTFSIDNDLSTITVSASVSGTAKVTPVIARTAKPSGDTWTDAASGAVTTTKPTSGVYVRVDAAGSTNNLTINGTVTSEGYGTAEHYNTGTAITQAVGSNDATSAYVPITAGSATAQSVSITSGSIAYNSSTSKFNLTATADNPAPTVSAGWVSSGTALTDGVSVAIALNKVELSVTDPGTISLTPGLMKSPFDEVKTGTWTTTQPSSGYYITALGGVETTTVTIRPKVKTEGYGTTSYYSADSSSMTVRATPVTTFIPIATATFANTATNDVTYTDISSTAPALISGSYLFINEGYTGNVKISLAKLVPDASDNASASYILSGYTAYNNDGTLLVGTIQTYAGAYEIVT